MSRFFQPRSSTTLLALAALCLACWIGCTANRPFKTWVDKALGGPDLRSETSGEASPSLDDETPVMPEGEFRTTASGLRYRIIKEGSGRAPLPGSTVMCHYRGWLDDGSEFDSSYKRNKPAEFSLKNVVPGWTEGLQLIAKGGKIELEVPSSLGYGVRGKPPTIPGGATLHFEIELLNVE